MELERLMKATVLIVEDDPLTLEYNERFIKEIEKERRREEAGILEFVVEKAESFEKAVALLTGHIQAPYDIVLLDLYLPEPSTTEHETRTLPHDATEFRGLQILDFIKETGAAETVIVVSAFPDENWLEVFRRGGSDFIKKPFQPEELHERVLVCWSRLLLRKSRQVFDERISELVPYAEKGLAHHFSACFSELVRAVARNAEEIEGHMGARYDLDRRKDPQDPFFRWLEGQEHLVVTAKNEWETLQAALLPAGESYREETVDDLLREIHHSLRPCLIIKNVRLEQSGEGAAPVLTFEDDVRAVLMEIVAGAVAKLPDFGKERQSIGVEVGGEKGQVKVSFSDSLQPISPEAAEKINRGASIPPNLRFEREWGLSVMQHVAKRGGGRIEVEPRQPRGNVITYFIPSAN